MSADLLSRFWPASLLVAAVVLASACAHVPSPPQTMVPLGLIAQDGSWTGEIGIRTLTITGAPSVHVERAEVFADSRNFLLLNSPVDAGRYVSLTVSQEDCVVGEKHYVYRVSACVAPDGDRYNCNYRLKGCAWSKRSNVGQPGR